MSEVDVFDSYDDDNLDRLLRNVQLKEPETNDDGNGNDGNVQYMLTFRPHCSRLSGLPKMKRLTAKRDWHPMRGGMQYGTKREAHASGQPCQHQQMPFD